MLVKVHLVDQKNKITLYKGNAILENINNSGQRFSFQAENHRYIWTIFDKLICIQSISEQKVKVYLKQEGDSKIKIENEFGQLDLKCRTSLYKISSQCIEVQYVLETETFHFCLFIEEAKYAIH